MKRIIAKYKKRKSKMSARTKKLSLNMRMKDSMMTTRIEDSELTFILLLNFINFKEGLNYVL